MGGKLSWYPRCGSAESENGAGKEGRARGHRPVENAEAGARERSGLSSPRFRSPLGGGLYDENTPLARICCRETHADVDPCLPGYQALVVNGGKPVVKVTREGVFSCGIPWAGVEGERVTHAIDSLGARFANELRAMRDAL